MTITAHKQKEGSWGRKEGWGMGWNFILSQVFLLGKERALGALRIRQFQTSGWTL